MKNIALLSVLACLFACQPKESPTIDYVLISGTVNNTDVDSIYVLGEDYRQAISLQDSSFADTLFITKAGNHTFYVGRERAAIYLENGYDLNITLDAKKFDETIAFSGSGSEENNILARIYMINEEVRGSSRDLYAKDESEFISIAKDAKSQAESAVASAQLEEDYKANMLDEIKYDYGFQLIRYKAYHGYYIKDKEFQVSDDYQNHEIQYSLDDEKAYKKSRNYRRLLDAHFNVASGDYSTDSTSRYDAMFLAFDDFKNPYIKEELMNSNTYSLFGPHEQLQDVYDYLSANTTNTEYLEEYKESYEKLKKLQKGMPSPTFANYENHAGGTTSFEDLKGKYAYIDVWATWCGPCIAEIPSLKNIEKEYHGKNIQFVSTSIDQADDHDTWVEMVTDKELGGTQLMADNAWKSQFVTDYEIKGIPRFILIDPEGNIVSADAPRPSSPNLKELLDELNI